MCPEWSCKTMSNRRSWSLKCEVPILIVQEEAVYVSKTIPQEHIVAETVEQVPEVPIPMTQEKVIHVPMII